MFCTLVIVSFVAALLASILWLFALSRSDADMLLMLLEKIGKKPASLAGKVVWVTGASSGIGEQIAYCLAKAGCRLVLSAQREEALEDVKAACLKKGITSDEDIFILPLDVMHYDTHKEAVRRVLEKFDQIDVLVNNAGQSQRAAWMEIELSVDRQLFEVNVLGQVSLTQEVLPYMLERKQGHIVVVSSLAGKIGSPMSRSYSGSKFAVLGFFESLRSELGEQNIDITMICPGPVFSNILMSALVGKPGEILGRAMDKSEKRMETDRCAYLICVAIANRMYEAWISLHPILMMTYISQYFPDFSKWLLIKFGSKQLMKMREGK